MIFDFRDRGERDLHDLPVCYLNFHAWRCEGLGGFHASDFPAHASAVSGNDLHVVLAVKWLQSCERLRYLQLNSPPTKVWVT